MERTDMIIEGDIHMEEYVEAAEEDPTLDLVSFNYYGQPSEKIDFIVNLTNGYRLKITVVDAERMDPWMQVGQPYNIYPTSDLEDKLSYTTVELLTQQYEPIYATNPNASTPPGINLDAFQVVKNDGVSIRCRMRDMTLYHASNTDRNIRINGTFVGALNFE